MLTVCKRLTERFKKAYRKLFKPNKVSINGVLLNVNTPAISASMRDILYGGKYESHESEILPKILKTDDRVLEVGTGLGFLAVLSSRIIGDGSKVCTFEANPLLVDSIELTKELNQVDFDSYNVILGQGEGEETFYISDKFYSSSLIKNDNDAREVKVKRTDVNKFIAEFKPTCLIVDIEGWETEFFKLIESFDSVKKILLEIHPGKVDSLEINRMLNLLYNVGFIIDYRISKGDVLYLKKCGECD